MTKDIYFKQAKLFNPHENQMNCFVYGAGSIGSHVVMGLAKIGIKNITVYDFDEIEDSNIPAQFYKMESKGLKVDCLKKIVKEFTGIDIEIESKKIEEDFSPVISLNSIHIVAFDNIEGRKLLIEKLKDFPVVMIDGRIGGFNYQKYNIRCDNDKEVEDYLKTLDGEFSELECGEKCLWVVNSMISSLIVSDIIRLIKKQDVSFLTIGNIMSDRNIVKNKEVVESA